MNQAAMLDQGESRYRLRKRKHTIRKLGIEGGFWHILLDNINLTIKRQSYSK